MVFTGNVYHLIDAHVRYFTPRVECFYPSPHIASYLVEIRQVSTQSTTGGSPAGAAVGAAAELEVASAAASSASEVHILFS